MLFSYLKKIFALVLTFFSSTLLFLGILFLSPYLCVLSWRISIYKLNKLKYIFSSANKKSNKKKILVLYRSYGVDDLEYLIKDHDSSYEFLFFPRNNIKKIYNKFVLKFSDKISDNHYHTEDVNIEKARERYRNFIKKILQKILNTNPLSAVISFNFRYHSEREVHKACKEIDLKFIVCQKESLIIEGEKEFYKKLNASNGRFQGHFMTVYTDYFKKLIVDSEICEEKNVFVIGMPRADYYFKNKEKKNNHILFLIPTVRQPYGYNKSEDLFNVDSLTTEVTKTLIDFAKLNSEQEIIFKSKIYLKNEKKQEEIISKANLKNCIFLKGGDSRNLIKDAKIVIGFNSTGLIESLLVNKHVILPYFDIKDHESYKKYTLNLKNFVHYAYSKNEMIEHLNKICNNSLPSKSFDNKEINDAIKFYIGNVDGKSSSRLKNALNDILK